MSGEKSTSSRKSSNFSVMTIQDIKIKEEKILRIHGYRNLNKVRPAIKKFAVDAARETETLVEPRVFYRMLKVRQCHGMNLELDGGAVFQNEAFERFLKDAQQVVAFVLTMGHVLDQAVNDYAANDQLLMALFLETAGWLGIEAATKTFSTHLRVHSEKEGLRVSTRLGPGYSYKLDGRSVLWPLEQQRTLFELFAQDAIDVELLESCAMKPRISRSGIYGLLATA